MAKGKTKEPTVPDLVVLSLLTERAMHGYEVNQELVRREVDDWAGVSRAQVYYSLRKLQDRGWVEATEITEPSLGPERLVVRTTAAGRAVIRKALAKEHWCTARDRPTFLTWLALSHLAQPATVRRGIDRRRSYLEAELAREKATLAEIRQDSGPMIAAAELMVELVISKLEAESAWIDGVETRLLAGRS